MHKHGADPLWQQPQQVGESICTRSPLPPQIQVKNSLQKRVWSVILSNVMSSKYNTYKQERFVHYLGYSVDVETAYLNMVLNIIHAGIYSAAHSSLHDDFRIIPLDRVLSNEDVGGSFPFGRNVFSIATTRAHST